MTDNHPASVHTAPLCRLPTLTDGPHSDRLTRLLAARPHLTALSLEAPLPLLLPLPPHLLSPNTQNVSKHAPHVPRPHLAQPLPARASSSFVGCGLRTSESTRSHDHARRRISLVLSSQGNISCPQQGLTRAGRSTAAPTSQLNARPTRRRPHGMRTFKGRVT